MPSTAAIEYRPEPEDYTITPTGPLGGRLSVAVIEGPFLCVVKDEQAALDMIRRRMDRERFWPNVWRVSDHGNWDLVTFGE